MVKPKDPSLIPSGDHCYRLVPLAPGEVVPEAGPEFGRLQRECMSRLPNTKQVLCPYHERTGYGTARCLFLGREVRFDFFRESTATQVAARFGSAQAVDWFEDDWTLWDMFKVCGVRPAPDPQEGAEDEDHPALNETDQRGRPVYRQLAWLSQGDWVENPWLGPGEVRDVLMPADGPVMVVVDFLKGGEHHLPRDEIQLRRVPNPARVSDAPVVVSMVEPPWRAITGLVGPGDLSNGLLWRRAQGRGPRGVPRVVQAVWPPFTQLGAVLDHMLVRLIQPGCLGLALRSTLWPAALPAREALPADLWPQGVACRWLEITDGCLFGVDDAAVEQAVRDLFAQFKEQVQALRVKAAASGNGWPAPQRVQLLLADGGWRVGLRLRFAHGYQPENRPWVVRWRLNYVSVVHRPTAAEKPPVAPLAQLAERSGLVGPFARLTVGATELPPLPRRRDASSARAMRMVRAAVPAYQQLRAAMSEVASHPWWCFDEVRRVFWIAARTLQDTDRPVTFPDASRTPARVMNILDWPDEGRSGVASLAVLGQMASLHKRVHALRQAALANGRWWPAPERVELVLVFESWVGMRMRFPDGYRAPWADWLTVWHPMPQCQRMPALPLPGKDLVDAVRAMPRRPALELPIRTLEEAGLKVTTVAQQHAAWTAYQRAPEQAEPLPPLPGCVWLLQTHVAGLAYHQVAQAAELQAGTLLTLRREPGNPHDALAIEVLTEAGVKLGYVPRNRNPVLARLMDAGERLSAQVLVVQAVDRPATGGVPAAPQVTDLRFRVDWVKGGDLAGRATCSTSV